MKIFQTILRPAVFATALLNANAASAALVNLSLTGEAQVGSSFSVLVWVDDLFSGFPSTDELLAFGLNVENSSPELFSFTGVNITAPFANDSMQLTLDAAGSAFPGVSNASGNPSVLLASLTFFAHRAGDGMLGIRSDLMDPNQGLIFSESAAQNLNADLAVHVSAVPLPASLPLLFTGISLLVGIARSRDMAA